MDLSLRATSQPGRFPECILRHTGLARGGGEGEQTLFHEVAELGEAHEQIRTSPFPIDQTYYFDEDGNATLERVAPDGTIRKPEGYPSEIADVEIRLGDTAGRRKIRVGDEARGKAEYNAARAQRHGGKKF